LCLSSGSGNKKIYRKLDIYRRLNQYGIVLKILKDSYRTGFLGCILYENGLLSFILLSEGIRRGHKIFSGFDLIHKDNMLLGSSFLLKNLGLFSYIHSVELFPLSGAHLAKSAGVGALIISKNVNKVSLKMASGWQ
jgi:large subunit ribosomal protein L2